MAKTVQADVLIIGGGIAGISLASALSGYCRVVVVDMEGHAGYHATGRSAASYFESYGNAAVRALTRASKSFFIRPPDGFTEQPLARMRPTMVIARDDQCATMDAYLADDDVAANVSEISTQAAQRFVPILQPESCRRATLEQSCMDLDVNQLLQSFLRKAKGSGASLMLKEEVQRIERHCGDWLVSTRSMTWQASIVVNAAGAWADEVAVRAGVRPIGIRPLRRSACIVPSPANHVIDDWPLTMNVAEEFYFKPDAGALLLSSADEEPSAPCDAAPEEMEIATAIDRVQQATALTVSRVISRWAGLRSFTSDKTPAIGFADDAENFFWLAGQGGYGVQSSPAASELAASLILDKPLPEWLARAGVIPGVVSPSRFAAMEPDRSRSSAARAAASGGEA